MRSDSLRKNKTDSRRHACTAQQFKYLKAGGLQNTFKAELPAFGSQVALLEGISAGIYALEEPLEIILLQQSADAQFIRIKAALFYPSLMPGCAGAGDPTLENTKNEHITVLVSISRKTAEADFRL